MIGFGGFEHFMVAKNKGTGKQVAIKTSHCAAEPNSTFYE
jgi:hypothetical protein